VNLLVFQEHVHQFVFFLVDRREHVFGPMFRDGLHAKRVCCGDVSADAGKHDLMDVVDFDQHGLF